MLLLKNLIPELNLWFGNILLNNDINIIHVSFPTLLSQKWRCRDSVIDLLFNECCDPSGNLYDSRPYIIRFKTLNLDRVYPYDPAFYRRMQVVRNRCYVFAADDPSNKELQDAFNKVTPSYIIDPTSNIDTIAERAGVTPTKYVTKYDSEIITSGNDQLYQQLPDRGDYPPQPEPGIYTPPEDIFQFTEEELEMLQYLYYYRTEQYEAIPEFEEGYYNKLISPLSKWVYLYLQCYLRNTVHWEYLNTICDMKTDGVLRTMYEKHAQDRIYQYIQKQYHIIWNEIDDIGGNELRRIFVDYTMPCGTEIKKARITPENLDDECIKIELDEQHQPVDSSTFEFIYDGLILKAGKDFIVKNDGTLKDTKAVIYLKDLSKFKEGTKYQMMWSNLTLTNPYTREEGFKKNG